MTFKHPGMRRALGLLCSVSFFTTAVNAASLTFTVNMSEAVTVTTSGGTPRIPIDIGGVPKYATYVSGTGTNALTFAYPVAPGDFDPDGIDLGSSLQLNGGAIADLKGNPLTNYGFSGGGTLTGVKIQTYTVAFDATSYNAATSQNLSFTINKAPPGGSYTVEISNGASKVTRTGTIPNNTTTLQVTNVDVSGLPAGTLTITVYFTLGGVDGSVKQGASTAALYNVVPSGYSLTGIPAAINLANLTSSGFTISGATIGNTYSYTISDGTNSVSASNITVTANPQPVTGIDLSSLSDTTTTPLSYSVTLTDANGNTGTAATGSAPKDTVAPTIASVAGPSSIPAAGYFDDN